MKAGNDMGNLGQAHVLERLCGQTCPPTAGSKQDKLAILAKHLSVIRRFRINPELQHTAGRMQSTRNDAIALQFTDVSDIN
jgi:hypothetical protein